MKDTIKTLTFKLRVTAQEFEVLADALAGSLEREAKTVHGTRQAVCTQVKVGRKVLLPELYLHRAKRVR
jgi:hypothetical protein